MSVSDETGSPIETSGRPEMDRIAAAKLEAALPLSEPTRMRKLSRAMMPAWKVRQLKVVQGGLCAICLKPVDLSLPREGVVDHNHDTGEIRGVLHRSCNAAEGKVANAAGSWGAKSQDYANIIQWLQNLLAYYARPGCALIYPTHVDKAVTAEKKRNARNLAAKERRAAIKARKAMRDSRNESV